MINKYSILNGFVMSLILLPSFFTSAISQTLLPIVSSSFNNKNIYQKKLNKLFSLVY